VSCYSKQAARCNLWRLCCPGLQNAKEGTAYTSQHLRPQSHSRTWHTGTTGRRMSLAWTCTCPAHTAGTGHDHPSRSPAGTRGQHNSLQSPATGTRIASRMPHSGPRADDARSSPGLVSSHPAECGRHAPSPTTFRLPLCAHFHPQALRTASALDPGGGRRWEPTVPGPRPRLWSLEDQRRRPYSMPPEFVERSSLLVLFSCFIFFLEMSTPYNSSFVLRVVLCAKRALGQVFSHLGGGTF